jgi:general secretion pathway protein K
MAPISREIDGGYISVEVRDAQARFNINLLALPYVPSANPTIVALCKKDPQLFECKYSVSQRRFIRFLQVIPLNEAPLSTDVAKEITDNIIAWLTPVSPPNIFGAEQDYYNGLDVPIVVSNGPMTSISELSLVKEVTPELYEKLLPYVIALPANGPNAALLNINTMPELMLRMFNGVALDIPADEAEGLELARLRNEKQDVEIMGPGQLGFQDPQDFIDNVIVGNIAGVAQVNEFDGTELVIGTKYFIYSAEVVIGDKTRRGKSLLFRDQGKVQTLWRTDANF